MHGPAAAGAVRRVQQQLQLWKSVQSKSPKNESLTTDRDLDSGNLCLCDFMEDKALLQLYC